MVFRERKRVVVVGAGMAGLGAAWRLFREGCEVVVLERSPRVGGRMAGRTEDGFCIDPSLQVLSARTHTLLPFINELGLSDRLLPLRPVRLGQVHQGRTAAIDPSTMQGVARMAGVHWRDVPRLLRFARLMRRYRPLLDPMRPERAADLDYRSVADFARLYFGESLFQRWIGPAATASAVDDEYELSRVAFLLAHVACVGGVTGLARQGLHEVARHAGEQLAARTGVEVTRIVPRETPLGDPAGFAVHTRSDAGAETLEADAVVMSCAADEAARIVGPALVPAERDFFAQVAYNPSIVLSIALDRPLTGVPLHVRVPHCEGSAVESHLLEPGSAEGRSPTGCGLLTAIATEAFSRSHLAADDGVVEKALRADLDRWYPRLPEVARFARLSRGENAVPRFRVGAYRALARFQRVQLDRRGLGRRLYYAGDYLAGPSVEAASASGERAARALLQDLG